MHPSNQVNLYNAVKGKGRVEALQWDGKTVPSQQAAERIAKWAGGRIEMYGGIALLWLPGSNSSRIEMFVPNGAWILKEYRPDLQRRIAAVRLRHRLSFPGSMYELATAEQAIRE